MSIEVGNTDEAAIVAELGKELAEWSPNPDLADLDEWTGEDPYEEEPVGKSLTELRLSAMAKAHLPKRIVKD